MIAKLEVIRELVISACERETLPLINTDGTDRKQPKTLPLMNAD